MDTRLLIRTMVGLALGLLAPGTAYAQLIGPPPWQLNSWARAGATLDLDFQNDRYFLNGTSYTGVATFIAGSGATFTRAGTTITSSSAPFYLASNQSWSSRAVTTSTYTSILPPFYLSASQGFVSRAGAVATYFDSTGTLQTAAANTARVNYTYNGSAWVNAGTLIEPVATNSVRNNTMQGAVASTAIAAQTITAMTDSSGTATVTTSAAHGLAVGNIVTVSGTSPAAYNGSFRIASIPSSTSFTYAMAGDPGANASTVGSYAAKTTGSFPTNWSYTNNNDGLVISVVGTCNHNGVNYVDYRFTGRTTSASALEIFPENTGAVSAGAGQAWTTAMYFQVTSDDPSMNNVKAETTQTNSGGETAARGYSANLASSRTTWQRASATIGSTASNTTSIRPEMAVSGWLSGISVDFTIRIGMPQLEQSAFATSVIATSGSAIARSADVYSNTFDGTYVDNTGTMQTAVTSAARDDHNPASPYADKGTLIEPASTNAIRNSTMQGAIASVAIAAQTISSIADASGTATVTTSAAHGLAVGNIVTVSGASPSAYNGTFAVASVPSTTTFTYAMASDPGANASTVGSYTALTAGTLPTDWSPVTATGVSIIVVGSGTEAGVLYVDVRFVGTPTQAKNEQILFEGTAVIAAASGQSWSASQYLRLSAGSTSGITVPVDGVIAEYNSSGTSTAADNFTLGTPSSAGLGTQRFAATKTLSGSGTAYVRSGMFFSTTIGTPIDATFRIGLPQLEQGSSTTSAIPTYGAAAVTRNADVYVIPAGGTYFDSTGTMQQAGPNLPRLDHSPTGNFWSEGILIEESRTNSLPNNTMVGAATGTPGTVPTGWYLGCGGAGLQLTIVGTGVEAGISYIDVQCSGTTTGVTNTFFEPVSSNTQVAASQGQTWSTSGYFRLTAGSWGSYNQSPRWAINEYNSSGTYLTQGLSLFNPLPTSAGLATQRFVSQYTVQNASTAYLAPGFQVQYASGVAVNFTVRIGMPQLELGAFPTSVIPTGGSTVTRAAERFTVPVGSWLATNVGTVLGAGSAEGNGSGLASLVALDDTTTSTRIELRRDGTSMSSFAGSAGGTTIKTTADFTSFPVNTLERLAYAYASGNSNCAASGTICGADGTNSFTFTPTEIQFGFGPGDYSGQQFDGWITRATYLPTREPDAALLDYSR